MNNGLILRTAAEVASEVVNVVMLKFANDLNFVRYHLLLAYEMGVGLGGCEVRCDSAVAICTYEGGDIGVTCVLTGVRIGAYNTEVEL